MKMLDTAKQRKARPSSAAKPLQIIPAAQTLEVLPAADPVTEDFAQARTYLHALRAMAHGTAAMTILLGCELKRLHKLHGVKRGGDRRSKDQTQGNLGLKWQDLVKRELGISDESARNYMAASDHAIKRKPEFLPIAQLLLQTPLGQLPEAQRAELVEKTRNLLPQDYNTQQLMWDWGILRKPKAPKGGDITPRDEDGNRIVTKLSPEEQHAENCRRIALIAKMLAVSAEEVKTEHYYMLLNDAELDEVIARLNACADTLKNWRGLTRRERETRAAQTFKP